MEVSQNGSKPNMNDLKSCCSGISKLRNYIAHFQYEEFEKNKKKCLRTLKYFEITMHCTMGSIHKLPNLPHKPSIKGILETLHSHNQQIFKNDRLLCDLFDDLAVLNGHSYNKLPAYWSILRQKYQIEKSIDEIDEKQEEKSLQMRIFTKNESYEKNN